MNDPHLQLVPGLLRCRCGDLGCTAYEPPRPGESFKSFEDFLLTIVKEVYEGAPAGWLPPKKKPADA